MEDNKAAVKSQENKGVYIIGLVLGMLVLFGAYVVWGGLFGILVLSATPQDMPIRWTLSCLFPLLLMLICIGDIIAYRKRIRGLLYALPVAVIVATVIYTQVFLRIGDR